MKSTEMRSLEPEEVESRVESWQEEYFRANCDKAVGQLPNTNVLGQLRRNIARAKTILIEKRKDGGE